MRDLTGQGAPVPLWTYGFWQSKERYKSSAKSLTVVKKYRNWVSPSTAYSGLAVLGQQLPVERHGLPERRIPQPQRMVDDIHALNAKLTISIWSSFGPATKQYRELEKLGALLNISTWPESGLTAWPPNMDYPSGVRVYDPYNPNARDIYGSI
jgi:alpha-D-xyloside xylohydrolase